MTIENMILNHPIIFGVGLVFLGLLSPFVAGVMTYILEAL